MFDRKNGALGREERGREVMCAWESYKEWSLCREWREAAELTHGGHEIFTRCEKRIWRAGGKKNA